LNHVTSEDAHGGHSHRADARGQSTIVSPAGLDMVEGSTSNNYPWIDALPRHYMQIHSDLKGPAMVVKALVGTPTRTPRRSPVSVAS